VVLFPDYSVEALMDARVLDFNFGNTLGSHVLVQMMSDALSLK
jgi:hypothetical protein